ncbi:hypothetical protein APSETT444_005860 [Aspergillus pseudonomiae]
MVDLSFGKASNMLVDGKESYILRTIRTDMAKIAYFSHLAWLFPFTKRLPFLNGNLLRLWRWIAEQVSERAQCEPERPDVFSWILNHYRQGPKSHQDTLNLHGDAHLIVVAGSDTVSTTLTNVFCHLASNPAITKELQSRLDALPDLELHRLAQIDLLDAILNETWRFQSPNPSGLQRVTPAEGLSIGDKFIPGNVIVQVPTYTVYRAPGQSAKAFWEGQMDTFTLVTPPLELVFTERERV